MRSLPPTLGSSRLRLAAAVVLLLVISLLPARMLGWANAIGDPVQALVAPLQQSLGRAAAWARGRVGPDAGLSPQTKAELAEMTRQRDAAQFALVQANAQIAELRKQISEISRGMELNNLPVTPIAAPVIGVSPDLSSKAITIRAGKSQGVEANNVAVVGGVHIVGLVKRVADRTSIVLPITDRASGIIDGRLMIGDTTTGPLCQLKPDGQGRLIGPVEDDPRFRDAAGRALAVEAGTRVRLFDRAWPLSAHGLIIGQVTRVEPLANMPLRSVVTVEPIEPIETAREVTIRTLSADQAAVEKSGGSP